MLLALALIGWGCGRPDLAGEWELINVESGRAFGDVMTVAADGKWFRTGFPPMAGTYEWAKGEVAFKVTEVAGVAIADMPKDGVLDIRPRLADVERQMVFVVEGSDQGLLLKQSKPTKGLAELRFRKKGG